MSVDDAEDAGGGLPPGWTLWNDEDEGRRILVYRPDVFDGRTFPPECMPTIFVSNASRARRPGAAPRRDATWRVTLFLEPAVEAPAETYDGREEAVAGANELARRFAEGEVDYRSLYQVPRETYFDRLDELTGRGEDERSGADGRPAAEDA
jgi:hypothetical protein